MADIISFLNSVNVPLLVADRDGKIRGWNSSLYEFFENRALMAAPVSDFLDIDVERIKKYAGESPLRFFEVSVLLPDGNKTADIAISLFLNDNEQLLVFTVRDRTMSPVLMPVISRLRSTIDSSPSPIVITDKNGIVEYVNSNFQILTGYSLDDISGKNVSILQPEFFSKDNSAMWDRLNSGEKWKGEFLNLKKNGELYWAIVSISPVFDDNNVTHYLSIQEDITYLKKIEEELKQSEEKLRILFESLPEGILVTDLHGGVIQVNRAYLRIFGYADRIMLDGRNIHDVFGSEKSDVIEELLRSAMEKSCSGVRGYELKRDDTVYIDLQAVLITDERGEPQGFLILAEDVTRKKNAEKALRDSEARNRALIEAIPDIMFRVNNEGVYLDKMLGTKINEVFPPEIAVSAVRHISDAIKTREIQIYEYPVTIALEERYYEARFIAIEDDEVLIILRNATERKKALDQIEDARRDAELANRAKSEFLANMSHEIRTPLNSITGFIELLMRTEVDEEQKEYLGIIRKSAANLLGIINDILDFSKIESNKLELSRIEFDPYSEFESVVRLFNVKALEKGIRFISFIDPLLPTGIISDPLRLKQVLSNFLSNAIKFTPEDGAVIIEIRLFRSREDVCMISFSVADTGIGIPERKQAGIFEAFTQADGSITRRYGGTGLGLSISSNLVKLLGSEIVLESKTGIGSRFYFTLEAEISRRRNMRDTFPLCGGLNACIISSSPDELTLLNLEYYLQSFGMNISFITRLDRCADERCDIFFVINSKTIPEQLRNSMDIFSGIPALLIAGRSGEEGVDEFRHLFRQVLYQPLAPEDFARSVINVLGLGDRVPDETSGKLEPGELKFQGRVLVGEDNRINQKLMMLLLRDYGVDVKIAGNGLDVFELYKKGKYDLIFMDINMPVADGIETAGMIRDYENENGIPHTPVIALTAKVLKGDRDIMLESGMDGYLSKPVEIDKLEEVLSGYLTTVAPDDTAEVNRNDYDAHGDSPAYYDLKRTAAELKIPVNVLESISRDFFDEADAGIIELKVANGESDYEMLRMISHKMKGAAANLRFARLAKMFDYIEENSSNRNKEFDYGVVFNNIKSELELLKSYF